MPKRKTKRATVRTKPSVPTKSPLVDWAEHANDPDPAVITALKAENARLRRRLTSTGAAGELIVQAVQEAYESPADFSVPRAPRPAGRKKDTEVAVCHVSDVQFGKVTPTYDSEIAAARLMEYAERVAKCINRRRAAAKIDELHLYLGGDMVEGELIFPGQAHEIDQSVFEQSVKGCPSAVARMIFYWLGVVQRVHVVSVPGNHGRPAFKNSGSHGLTNWDNVVAAIVELLVLGPEGRRHRGVEKRVTFSGSGNWYAVDDVLGHKNLVVHGHQIRGGFGGFPFYGVGKRVAGWIDAIPEEWHNLYFGHFHSYYSGRINERGWYCNGTPESDNDYARQELAAAGRPRQRLQFFNARHGMVADYPINLTYGLEDRRRAG